MKIRKRNIKGLLILAGLFLVFLCRSADAAAQESRGMITDFERVENACVILDGHIPLERLKAKMPREISVHLNGSEKPVRIAADWTCSADYELTRESYYLFLAQWDQTQYPLDPGYNPQGYLPFVEVMVRDGGQPVGAADLTGIDNIVKRAYQQVEIAWTPLKQVKGYTGVNGKLTATYYAGVTYRGIPYGQLVYSGRYIPADASFDTFLAAVNDPGSVFYTARGTYDPRDSTYYGNDCSAFVSYAYGLPRMTTGMIDASSQFTRVPQNNIYNAQVGDCFNKSTSHVELITGMLYNDAGTLLAVEVCEQTPPKARRLRYTPAQVQSILNSGYVLLRYNGRYSVKEPYYYTGYKERKETLSYIGDKFDASIINPASGLYVTNDGAGNVCAKEGTGNADQVWYFEAQSDGTYAIASCRDGTYMGVHDSNPSTGTNVEAGNYTGAKGQRWYVYRGAGTYKLIAASSTTALNLSDRANLTMEADSGADAQKFEIRMRSDGRKSLFTAEAVLETDSYVYDGTAKEPEVSVKIGDTVLKKDLDYQVGYSENVEAGTARAVITGIGNYVGGISREFTIQKAPQNLQITLSSDTGKEGTRLRITVSGNQTELAFSSDDKTVARVGPKGNVACLEAGEAQIRITAAGNNNYESAERTILLRVEHAFIDWESNGDGTHTRLCAYNPDHDETENCTFVYKLLRKPEENQAGELEITCPVCGYHEIKEVVLENCAHEITEVRDGREAECEADGFTGDTYCVICGALLEPGSVIPAAGHTWDAGVVTKEPAVGQEGIRTFTCEVCKETREEILPALEEPQEPETSGNTEPEIPGNTEPAVPEKPEQKRPVPGSICRDSASGGIYKVRKDRASVVYQGPVSGNKRSIIIPNVVKIEGVTCKVAAVAADAFKNNKNLRQITIGKNVEEIGACAFQNCANLAEVFGGKGIKVIRRDAFSGCVKLGKITLKSEVTTVCPRAFKNCRSLTNLTLPGKITGIGAQAFYGCSGLKRLTIKTLSLNNRNTGANAFKGIGKNAVAVVPKKVLTSYAKLLKARGMKGSVRG